MNSDSTEGAGMIEALAWLEVNKKRLAIAAVVIFVVGFGVYVWSYFTHEKEVKASAALLELRPTGPTTNQVPVPSSAFIKVAQDHKGTAAGERANLLAAGALFTEGKYADAYKAFDDFLRSYPSSPWAFEAAYGIATSLEAQGKRDEALTAYQRVLTTYAGEATSNDARMALARIYQAKGQFDLALKQYDEVAKPATGGMNPNMQEAFMQRERLLRAHPELKPAPAAATNAPATSFTITNSVPMKAVSNAAPSGTATPPKSMTTATPTNAAAPKK